ncbi:hypothetical protein P3T37_004340 [Kitasatospora sp. MAA4]|uniref:hypothetical protein n=1 Tax=Kitasatospora sp. MAA4 TaxID=3035093 RepID=UPI002474A7CD|nr:hypothetical protein [Kitasatospora sp. MAA4]MDH6134931.1 hypothetical protein [Kitasatospora sp. MAA4]
MTAPTPCPAIAAFHQGAVSLAERATSDSRRRCILWIAGEWERAVSGAHLPPGACSSLRALISAESFAAYLTAARTGALRQRGSLRTPSGQRSERERISITRAIAEHAGILDHDLPEPGVVALVEPMTDDQWRAFWRTVNDPPAPSTHSSQREVKIRTAAVAGVVRETGLRISELAEQTVTDLEALDLSPHTRAAVRRWLALRAELVSRLRAGATTAAWVRVRTGTVNGKRLLAGLPCGPKALQTAHGDAVRETNARMTGAPGWTPAPTRPEQLRRSNANRRPAPKASGAASPDTATCAA